MEREDSSTTSKTLYRRVLQQMCPLWGLSRFAGRFNLIIYELDQGNIDGAGPEVMFLRCLECGNTFKIDVVKDEKVFTCSVCETDYVTVAKDGKAQLKEFMDENDDFGELLYRDVAT